MKAKDYLSRIWQVDRLIESKLRTVTELRDITVNISPAPSDTERVQTPYESKLEKIVIKIVDLEKEIEKAIDDLVDMKRETMKLIDKLENHDYRALLSMRYINRLSFEVIAYKMGYTYRWTVELHGQALKAFEELMPSEGDSNFNTS